MEAPREEDDVLTWEWIKKNAWFLGLLVMVTAGGENLRGDVSEARAQAEQAASEAKANGARVHGVEKSVEAIVAQVGAAHVTQSELSAEVREQGQGIAELRATVDSLASEQAALRREIREDSREMRDALTEILQRLPR